MAKKQSKAFRLHRTVHPVLFEVNIRVLLGELSEREGKRITLKTIPDGVLDEWAGLGFDAVWLMGVWTTGAVGRDIARTLPGLQEEYRKALPDVRVDDILSSPYAVQAYEVSIALGGNAGLAHLRRRLADRGLGLILDFVSNHTARDHRWVTEHPEYYINGESGDDKRKPELYFRTKTAKGEATLAFGRDPTFPGWTDTAQLNPMDPAARRAMIALVQEIAGLCDGIRCDMAMLILQDVFLLTWGDRVTRMEGGYVSTEFWKEAIDSVTVKHPGFLFVAEAYWNMEWQLQQQGFDYTYDKILYDRLLREGAGSVRDHLRAEMDFQRHSVRFIENHDEPRAIRAFASEAWHMAAAVVMATVPGMLLLHDGQLEGMSVKLPVQLSRRPAEPVSERLRSFYRQILACVTSPVFQQGEWHLLSPRAAWHDNPTWQNYLIHWWEDASGGAWMVVVNYAPHSGQCYVEIPVERLNGNSIEFRDFMGEATYLRQRAQLMTKGMYFDLPGYAFHVFEVTKAR